MAVAAVVQFPDGPFIASRPINVIGIRRLSLIRWRHISRGDLLGLPVLEFPVSFSDMPVQFIFGLEGVSGDAVGESRGSQVHEEGVEFLMVIAVLSDHLGPDLVEFFRNLIFQCRDIL